MRIGLIGASRIADDAMIVPAGKIPSVSVVAVAARDPARARTFAQHHGIDRVYDSYGALFNAPDVDLVYIATPPSSHAALALRSIAAGKATLVEKPFAMHVGEARCVADAARMAGIPVFEAMHSLHHDLFARLDDIIGGGQLGEIRSLEAEFSTPIDPDPTDFRWSSALGGGALMDLGVYPLAWCRRLAGEAFEVVTAGANWRRGIDTDFRADLAFDNGIRAAITSSMVAPTSRAVLRIVLDRGTMTVDNPLAPQLGNRITVSVPGGQSFEAVGSPSTYLAQLRAVEAALSGTAPFPLPPDDFVASMIAIDRVRQALPRD